MIPTIFIDSRQFRLALADYVDEACIAIPDVLNRKMNFILPRAYAYTPKVARTQITSELGGITYERVVTKQGRFKRLRMRVETPLIYKIVNAIRKKKGKAGLSGRPMEKAAASFIQRRFGTRGTLKRGWLAAIKHFRNVTGVTPPGFPEDPKSVKGKSTGVTAKKGDHSHADVIYHVLSTRKGVAQFIDYRLVAALQRAIDDEAASMRHYIAMKLQEAARKTGCA